MNQTTKKQHARTLRRIFTLTALFALLFCVAGCSKKTPREALDKAYEKTFADSNPFESILGVSELNTKLSENKAHSTGYSLTVRELSGKDLDEYAGYLTGLGISVDSASDLMNRKSAGTLDITYGGTTYLTLGGQIQGSEIFLTCPQLLNSSLSVNLSTLKEDLNSDSALAELFRNSGLTLPEDFSADFFEAITSAAAPEDLNDLISAYEALDEALIVEKLGKKEITLPSDVTAKTVYKVTVPKHAYVAFINAVLEYANESSASLSEAIGSAETDSETFNLLDAKLKVQEFADAAGDIVITVAVTKEGYINYMVSTVTAGEDTATFTASLTGANAPLEECKIVMDATVNNEAYHFDFVQKFGTKLNDVSLFAEASKENTKLFSFDCAGTFDNIEKGQKYTLDLDYLDLEYGDTLSVSLTGDYYVDTTECNIAAPAASEYNLLRMSEEDFSALFAEVLTNLSKDPLLSGLLGYFMGQTY